MTYPKRYNTETAKGMLLIDIIVALSLAALFVVVCTQVSGHTRDIYDYAVEKNALLDIYRAHASEMAGLLPHQSQELIIPAGTYTSTTTISASARWYGNDRIQTDITVSSNTASVYFTSVRSIPVTQLSDFAGSSLCSVDFSGTLAVGSYEFDHHVYNTSPQSLIGHMTITPLLLPIPPSIPLTDIEVRNDIAYVTTDSAKASDPDLFVIDIHDEHNPVVLSGLNTGPGVAALAIGGRYAYLAATSRIGQLQIVDLADLGRPSIVVNYRVPLPQASTTAPLGSSIYYTKDRIYLGTERWDGDEVAIIDVSDPAHPAYVGGLNTDSKVNDLRKEGDMLYVAASDQHQLRAIGLHDEHNPLIVDTFDPSGWQRQEGKTINYFEDEKTFGRTSGGFNIKQDAELFYWSATTSTISLPTRLGDIPGGVYGLVQDRSFVFALTRQTGSELQIYDKQISTSTALSVALPTTPQVMTCDGDAIYVVAMNTPIIYKISFK